MQGVSSCFRRSSQVIEYMADKLLQGMLQPGKGLALISEKEEL